MKTALSTMNGILSLLFLFLFLSLPTLSLSQTKCHPDDLKALRRIQQGMGNPPELSYWQTQEDCCSWSPIVLCFDSDNPDRVTHLHISGYDTVNHIPDAIGDLPYLGSLMMIRLPNLTGGIPFGLTRLTRLDSLQISGSNISGPIPSFLAQIKSLYSIYLTNSRFSGSIPPSLSSLPVLETLYLSENRLTGVIPESFGNFQPSFRSLTLNDNRLRGTVPRSFGYRNFTWLELSRNRLEGDVSFLFGRNKTYENVDLSWNKFSFDGSRIKFNKELNLLYVNNNLITGNLLPSLKHSSNLGLLNVSYNLMCGEIPNVKSLKNFDYTTYFHNKCLCGSPLPPCK